MSLRSFSGTAATRSPDRIGREPVSPLCHHRDSMARHAAAIPRIDGCAVSYYSIGFYDTVVQRAATVGFVACSFS